MKAHHLIPIGSLVFITVACGFFAQPTQKPIAQPISATDLPAPAQTDTGTVEFNPSKVNQVPPDDILEEISYFGQGGGGEVCELYTFSEPTLAEEAQDSELMLTSTMVTCGWAKGQTLETTVTYPDGRKTPKALTVTTGEAVLVFQPNLSDPEGIYEFKISGNGVEFISNAYFRKPSVPDVYELNENQILFNNFSAGEKIRLVMYVCENGEISKKTCHWRFAGWQEYEMNKNGNLIVDAPVKDGYFVAITVSGIEIPVFSLDTTKSGIQEINKNATPFSTGYYPVRLEGGGRYYYYDLKCADDFHSQITAGLNTNLVVKNVGQSGISFYANPRTTAHKVMQLHAGDMLSMVVPYKPVCVENKIWWPAQIGPLWEYGPAFTGYIVEEYENQTPSIESVVRNPVGSGPLCKGLKSRITAGMQARSAFTDGSKMRIRAKPGFSQEILNTVPEGTVVSLLKGPECADGSAWWYVITKGAGQEGWMAEYQENVYLLEPIP